MQLFSESSKPRDKTQKSYQQIFFSSSCETKYEVIPTEFTDPFMTDNSIGSSQKQASIKLPNSSTTLDFMCLRQDFFEPPVIQSISISNCTEGLKKFSQMSFSLRRQYKPNTVPLGIQVGRQSMREEVRAVKNTKQKQLLEDYEYFHQQMLDPLKQSILKSQVSSNRKMRLSTQSQKELKPVFISLSSRLRQKNQTVIYPIKQTNYFFCCGSFENIDRSGEAHFNLDRKRYNYQRK